MILLIASLSIADPGYIQGPTNRSSAAGYGATGSFAGTCEEGDKVYDDNGALSCQMDADSAPGTMVLRGVDAYEAGSTNKTGGNLILQPGHGTKTIVIDDADQCSGAVVTLDCEGDGGTAYTEASEWTLSAGDDAATCASLASAIEANACVKSAACSTATVQVQVELGAWGFQLSEDTAACTTVANNTRGNILLNGVYNLATTADGTPSGGIAGGSSTVTYWALWNGGTPITFTFNTGRVGFDGNAGISRAAQGTGVANLIVDSADQDNGAGYLGTDQWMLVAGGQDAVTFTEASNEVQQLWDACTFANLGTPSNGSFCFCSDCTKATPCAGSGDGALAKRLNGAWDCD